MPQQEVRRNYIGLVNDTTEDERVANATKRSQPHVVLDLVNRLADALIRRRKSAPGRTIAT